MTHSALTSEPAQAFHPRLPIVATCGSDRTLALWHVPEIEASEFAPPAQVVRVEAFPIWSSTQLHSDWLTSVAFATETSLITTGRLGAAPDSIVRDDVSDGRGAEPYEIASFAIRLLAQLPNRDVREDELLCGVETEAAFTIYERACVIKGGGEGWTPKCALWLPPKPADRLYVITPAHGGVTVAASDALCDSAEVFGAAPSSAPIRCLAASGPFAAACDDDGAILVFRTTAV